mmetsp:Transcript_18458/g.25517  ORF Transcript_18458/g.25517 Transcript_18458/m.25517 type:complete len:142 (-) Transcript_18458:1112-1537(-)
MSIRRRSLSGDVWQCRDGRWRDCVHGQKLWCAAAVTGKTVSSPTTVALGSAPSPGRVCVPLPEPLWEGDEGGTHPPRPEDDLAALVRSVHALHMIDCNKFETDVMSSLWRRPSPPICPALRLRRAAQVLRHALFDERCVVV